MNKLLLLSLLAISSVANSAQPIVGSSVVIKSDSSEPLWVKNQRTKWKVVDDKY